MQDNIKWISAQENKLSGSSPNICWCRRSSEIAEGFKPPAKGEIGTIILGRDHHDVSGTDFHTETSNIYDGSCFTADM
jgi:urocanate hydratase